MRNLHLEQMRKAQSSWQYPTTQPSTHLSESNSDITIWAKNVNPEANGHKDTQRAERWHRLKPPGAPASIKQSSLTIIKDWPWPGGETSHRLLILSSALDGSDKGTSWRGESRELGQCTHAFQYQRTKKLNYMIQQLCLLQSENIRKCMKGTRRTLHCSL